MRKGWKVKTLEDICDIVNGATPLRSNKTFWENGEFPWFTIDDIREQGRLIAYTRQNVTNEALKKLRVLPTNSILLCCTASIGEFAITKIPLTTNQQFNGLIVKDENEVYPYFLFHFCATLKDKLLGLSGKTTIDFIPISRLKAIELPVPPLTEQKQIVSILDKAFAAIDKAKQNAEKNLQNAKELFESYLQEVFVNQSKKWEKKKLSEIALTFGRGRSRHRPRNDKKLYGGKYPFIQTGDIRNSNHIVTEYSQTYNEVGLTQSKLWPKGTLCITIAANIAETAILGFDACFPDSVIGLVVNPKLADVSFIEFLLQSFKIYLQTKGKGSAQDNINLGTFENEFFPIPDITVQKSILAKLHLLSSKTRKLEVIYEQKIADIEELKKSILQKAFSGELTHKHIPETAAQI